MKSLLLSLLLIPALAVAADDTKPKKPGKGTDKPKANPAAAFKKMDTSGDGTVSLEEFKASPRGQKNPDKADKAYAKLDKDSDGKLTLEEFKAASVPKPEKPKKKKPAESAPDEAKPDAPKTEEPKKSV